jgi:hypothetical protein
MSADSALGDGAISARGVIHDRGYRRYEGPRLGRPQIIRALVWHSFRSALGIGRGPKAKIMPVIAFVAICLPAIINAVSVAKGGNMIVSYGTYSYPLRVIVLTVFVAVQAPELVSRDLRSRVLPLYFSRPMRRGDYPLAKYLVAAIDCRGDFRFPAGRPGRHVISAARCCRHRPRALQRRPSPWSRRPTTRSPWKAVSLWVLPDAESLSL